MTWKLGSAYFFIKNFCLDIPPHFNSYTNLIHINLLLKWCLKSSYTINLLSSVTCHSSEVKRFMLNSEKCFKNLSYWWNNEYKRSSFFVRLFLCYFIIFHLMTFCILFYSNNMENIEMCHWNISSSTNLLILGVWHQVKILLFEWIFNETA